ncbi:MAG: hypothetical protein ACXWT4_16900 [Methylobacter sp.]
MQSQEPCAGIVRKLSESCEPLPVIQNGEAKLVVMGVESDREREEQEESEKLALLNADRIFQG